MRSLRVWSIGAALLALSAAPLSAQSSKVTCKDGSKPKSGHFSCWGHGGLVAGAVKHEAGKGAKAPAATTKKAKGGKGYLSTTKVDKKKSAKKPAKKPAKKATK